MLVKEFSFNLPDDRIARFPMANRDASRLMMLDRSDESIRDHVFSALPDLLAPGDLLIMNDTRVIPARIFGVKETGGKVEIFLVRRQPGIPERWECLLRGSKRFRPGQVVKLADCMQATAFSKSAADTWLVDFSGEETFDSWLERNGHMPLPPYLQRDDNVNDRERYQTVVARNIGAVAAPTAGLHFTGALLDELKNRGISLACITLHTGLGTFQPVRVERVADHRIHLEDFVIPQETVTAIEECRVRGGRVVAVGTTTARTLEFAAQQPGGLQPGSGTADIFIYPGYRFKVVDALVTNFHLPESTLLMLVSAFAGRDFVLAAYQRAIEDGYRFYSYGDAMLIV